MAQGVLGVGPWLNLVVLLFCIQVDAEQEILKLGLQFTIEPTDTIAVRGQSAVLNCYGNSTTGSGPVTVSWLKDRKGIHADGRINLLSNGSLYISRVQRKRRYDEGDYECRLQNNIGSILSKPAKLRIASIGRLRSLSDHNHVEGLVNQVTRIICPLRGYPDPKFKWSKDGENLNLPQILATTPPPQHNNHYTLLPSGALEINGVTQDDAGTYRCRATNIAGVKNSQNITLTVQIPESSTSGVSLLTKNQNITKLLGSIAVLECAAEGAPVPSITWTRQDGAPIADMITSGRFSLVSQGTLIIRALEVGDSGMYSCAARNTASERPVIQRSRLTVIVPPTVRVSQPATVWTTIQQFQLTCHVTGTPRPTISWMYGGEELTPHGRIKFTDSSSVLRISQVDVKDSGLYQCHAENEAGAAQATAQLSVQVPANSPDPPGNLQAVALSSRSMQLYWTPPSITNGSSLVGYSIHYMPTEGGTEIQKVVSSTATEERVDLLRPYTNYTFYLVSYNSKSHSSHSRSVVQRTEESVPRVAPACRLSSLGVNSLKVEWDALTPQEAQGIVVSYKIYYRRKDSHSEQADKVAGTATSYIITGLDPEETYEVRVGASTAVGSSSLNDDHWPWLEVSTGQADKEGVLRSPVIDIAEALNCTSVQLAWQPVMDGQEQCGYILLYNRPGGMEQRVDIPHGQHNYVLNNLVADAWYELRLLAYSEFNESEPTVRSIKVPASDEPPMGGPGPLPPTHIEAQPINQESIRLTWRKPPLSGEEVESYTIMYRPITTMTALMNRSDITTENSEDPDWYAEGLSAYTTYEFSVRANTDQGHGPYSQQIRCKTQEGRPSAPISTNWHNSGPGAIKLSWRPPLQKNGVIVSYEIRYSQDHTVAEEYWYTKKENGSVTVSNVENLQMDAMYYFKLRAATSVGPGAATKIIEIHTSDNGGLLPRDSDLGIIIGVIIGGSCLIVCAICITLLFKNRCRSDSSGPASHTSLPPDYTSNGYLSHQNGHTYAIPQNTGVPNDSQQPLCQSLQHCDTKGGSQSTISRSLNYTPPKDMKAHYLNGHVSTSLTEQSESDSSYQGGRSSQGSSCDRHAPNHAHNHSHAYQDVSTSDPTLRNTNSNNHRYDSVNYRHVPPTESYCSEELSPQCGDAHTSTTDTCDMPHGPHRTRHSNTSGSSNPSSESSTTQIPQEQALWSPADASRLSACRPLDASTPKHGAHHNKSSTSTVSPPTKRQKGRRHQKNSGVGMPVAGAGIPAVCGTTLPVMPMSCTSVLMTSSQNHVDRCCDVMERCDSGDSTVGASDTTCTDLSTTQV